MKRLSIRVIPLSPSVSTSGDLNNVDITIEATKATTAQ